MAVYLLYMISPLLIEAMYRTAVPRARFDNERTRNRYIVLCGIVMFLMIGLRSYQNGSGDSKIYYELWRRARNLPLNMYFRVDMEKGFLLSIWILSRLFAEQQWVFLFSGAFFAIAVSRFVEKYCDDACLAFVVFNCLGLFNFYVQGMRQSIAMGICMFAIDFCKERKLLQFLGVVVTAMCFHGSAVVFFVVYPIWGMKLSTRNLIFAVLAAMIAFRSLGWFFSIGNQIIEDHYAIGDTRLTSGGGFTLAIHIVCVMVGLLLAAQSKRNESVFTNISFFAYMTIICAVCFAMRYSVTTIMERVSFFFTFGEMLLISKSTKLAVRSQRSLIRLIVIALCFGVAVHKAGYSSLVPYRFFWM